MIANLLLLKNKTVLLAEDENIMREHTAKVLEMICKKVFSAQDGEKAYEIYEDESPDFIISDIKMPIMDGLQLIQKIRLNDYQTPIVLMSSFSEKNMLVQAVNLSVDGYLIKPFELNIFVNTITKSMQRSQKNNGIITLAKDIYYNLGTQEVYKNGAVVSLGAKEFELLQLLIKNSLKTVTKEEISQALWPLESICESAIKNLVLRMRKKIDTDMIVSVRGIGYRLNHV